MLYAALGLSGWRGAGWADAWRCSRQRVLLTLLAAAATHALPSIRFDHPTQDFEFAPAVQGGHAKVVLAFAALADPAWRAPNTFEARLPFWERGHWSVIVDLNAQEIGRWRAAELLNALGEVDVTVTVPELPPGEHVASCRLVQGDESPQHVDPPEHTISFYVRDSPRPPPPPPDMWTPLLCSSCSHAFACASTDGLADDVAEVEAGGVRRGSEVQGGLQETCRS
jgi:hypothetical protein